MIKKIANSLAFRLPVFYRLMVLKTGLRAASKAVAFTEDYNLVIMCGSQQVDMLAACLKSIHKNFTKLPAVILFTDLKVNVVRLRQHISFYPADRITLIKGEDCISYHQYSQNNSLVKFARNNPMGLKLAAILQALDIGKPVLYCDTDVLWYNDPDLVIKKHLQKDDFELIMSEDFQPAYDARLIEKSQMEQLNDAPFFCAGIMLIKRLSHENVDTLNKLLRIAEEQSGHFSEQTIFACLNRNTGNMALDKNKFLLKTDDQFHLRPKTIHGLIARHYIGPVRHLFWRDALWLN